MQNFLILGAGYTGGRVTRLLTAAGHRVIATHRTSFDVADARSVEQFAEQVPDEVRILHSIPVLKNGHNHTGPTPLLAPILRKAERIVYLSTTGVYGEHHLVDERTPAAPRTRRESLRVEEELAVAAMCSNVLVLRPAAIYGPHRGVHVSLRNGSHKVWGDGSNYISRIHVDDLAALCVAALHQDLTGAFPVADEHPCTSWEITEFCAAIVGVEPPRPSGVLPPSDTRSANRRVDGSAVRRALGVSLRYPSYREGVPAAIAEENANRE